MKAAESHRNSAECYRRPCALELDMRCFGSLLLLVIGLLTNAIAVDAFAEDLQVTFRLHTPQLPKNTTVYITGSNPGLGNWHPGRVPMREVGDHSWTYNLKLSEAQTLEYKYTLGSWDREGADASGQPLANMTVKVDQSLVKEDAIFFWTDRQERRPIGQITGKVHYHLQMQGQGIANRTVIVWLPPDYGVSDERYPVLYMHDGQNLFDPNTSAFGIDWQIDETCTRLIREGAIPPLIVVGIYNTPSRTPEYTPGLVGAAYRKFVVEVVKPFVDDRYRTLSGRESTFVGGSSAGGLCAFILAWEYPHVFSKALCMSPAFQFELPGMDLKLDYVAVVEKADRPKEGLFFYIDNGSEGLEEKLQPGIDGMLAALQAKGYEANKDYRWTPVPEAHHSEADWAKRFPAALKALIQGEPH